MPTNTQFAVHQDINTHPPDTFVDAGQPRRLTLKQKALLRVAIWLFERAGTTPDHSDLRRANQLRFENDAQRSAREREAVRRWLQRG